MTVKVELKIEGIDKVKNNIDIILKKLPTSLKQVTDLEINRLDTLAMKNLYSNIKTGMRTEDSIRKKIRKEGEFEDTYRYTRNLEYYSKHAEIVEFGGGGEVIHAEDYGYSKWPIGKSQYGVGVYYSPTFKLQPGKQFLSNALYTRTAGYNISDSPIAIAYKRRIISDINSLGIK